MTITIHEIKHKSFKYRFNYKGKNYFFENLRQALARAKAFGLEPHLHIGA